MTARKIDLSLDSDDDSGSESGAPVKKQRVGEAGEGDHDLEEEMEEEDDVDEEVDDDEDLNDFIVDEIEDEFDLEDDEETKMEAENRKKMFQALRRMEGVRDGEKILTLCQIPATLRATLHPHQHIALSWMYNAEIKYQGGILGDDQGLGKTIETISLFLKNTPEVWAKRNNVTKDVPKTNLCVLPVSLMRQWKAEVEKFSDLSVFLYHGLSKAEREAVRFEDYDVVLTTYSTMRLEGTFPRGEPLDAMFSRREWTWNKKQKGEPLSKAEMDDFNSLGPLFRTKWFRVVLDESHKIKNASTSTFRAAMLLLSVHRWCLTGTPIHNSLDDLRSQLWFLKTVPVSDWAYKISKPIDRAIKFRLLRAGNLRLEREEANAWKELANVTQKHILRRTKNTDAPDRRLSLVPLPQKEVRIRRIPMSDYEKELYSFLYSKSKEAFLTITKMTKKLNVILSHVFVWLILMRQFCNHPLLAAKGLKKEDVETKLLRDDQDDQEEAEPEDATKVKSEDDDLFLRLDSANLGNDKPHPHLEQLYKLWDSTNFKYLTPETAQDLPMGRFWPSSKMNALFEDLEALQREQGHVKALVFSQFTRYLDIIQFSLTLKGFKCVRLDGTMSQDERQVSIEQFQSDQATNVFLISLCAGGLGLNLITATHAFILDPWWNCSLEHQAIDRVHRIGQLSEVHVVRYIVDHSIEEDMLTMQDKKQALSAGAFSEKFPDAKTLTIKDLKNIFNRNTMEEDKGEDHSSLVESLEARLAPPIEELEESVKQEKKDKKEEEEEEEKETVTSAGEGHPVHSRVEVPTLASLSLRRLMGRETPEVETLVKRLHEKSIEMDSVTQGLDLTGTIAYKKALEQICTSGDLEERHIDAILSSGVPDMIIDNRSLVNLESSLIERAMFTTKNLSRLTLIKCKALKRDMLFNIGEKLPYLTSLALRNCGHALDDEVVSSIMNTCTQLTSLDLTCAYKILQLDSIMKKEGLEHLCLRHCHEVKFPLNTSELLGWRALETLESLDLSFCKNLLGQARNQKLQFMGDLEHGADGRIAECLSRSKQLQVLRIAGWDGHQLNEKAARVIATRLFLKELDVSDCATVFQFHWFLPSLVESSEMLQVLRLNSCIVPTRNSRREQRESERWKMETVYVANLSAKQEGDEVGDPSVLHQALMPAAKQQLEGRAELELFKENMENTEKAESGDVNVEEEKQEKDPFQVAAARGLRLLAKLTDLRELDLYLVGAVEKSVLQAYAKAGTKLTRLVLSGCAGLSKSELRFVLSIKTLGYLDLSWCLDVDTKFVEQLLSELPYLAVLLLWGCSRVDQVRLSQYLQKFPRPSLRIIM